MVSSGDRGSADRGVSLWQMRRVLLVVVLAGLGAAGTVAAASSTRASFADGTWRGTARLSTTIEGIALTANSTFTMRVRAGRVTGTMISNGAANGTTQGTKVSVKMTGRYPFSGTAAKPVARGKLNFVATVDGKPQTAAGDVVNTFGALRGTCDRMTGKITLTAGKPDPSAQGPQSISAPFVATRTPGSGPRC